MLCIVALLLPDSARAQQPVRRDTSPHSPRRHAPRAARRQHRSTEALVLPQGDGSPLLAFAAHLIGRPYRLGSEEGAFDCSGFVRKVFAAADIDLPHSAQEQFALGTHIARDELEPGDLVFFHSGNRRHVSHVGIYAGEDKFVHAVQRHGKVQVDSLTNPYYAGHFAGARRVDADMPQS